MANLLIRSDARREWPPKIGPRNNRPCAHYCPATRPYNQALIGAAGSELWFLWALDVRGTLLCVEIDDALDRAGADRTESDVVAGEHDAVHRRPVESLGLVHRSLEGTHLPRVLFLAQGPGEQLAFLVKQLFEGLLGRPRGTQFSTALLRFP